MVSRYTSIAQNPLAAVDRLRSKLPDGQPFARAEASVDITAARAWRVDELLVSLIQNTELDDTGRSIAEGEQFLADFKSRNPTFKQTWKDLVDAGWMRVLGGRWFVPYAPGPAGDLDDDRQMLRAFLSEMYKRTLGRIVRSQNVAQLVEDHRRRYPATPSLERLVQMGVLQEGTTFAVAPDGPHLSYFAPWVMARVWEQKQVGPVDARERLRWWRHRVRIPYGFIYDQVVHEMDAPERKRLTDGLWNELRLEPDFLGWKEEENRLRAALAARRGDFQPDELGDLLPAPPTTMADRLEWLESESYLEDNQTGRGFHLALLRALLINELDDRSSVEPPNVMMALEAGEDRPAVLDAIQHFLSSYPKAIAAVLIQPRWAAIGLIRAATVAPAPGSFGFDPAETADVLTRLRASWLECVDLGLFALAQAPRTPGTAGEERVDAARDVADVLEWLFARREQAIYGPLVRDLAAWPRERCEIFKRALEVHSALNTIGRDAITRVASKVKATPQALTAGAFASLRWLSTTPALGCRENARDNTVLIVEKYVASLAAAGWFDDCFEPDPAWVDLAKSLCSAKDAAWQQLLRPQEFETSSRENIFRARTHLRLLAFLCSNWGQVRTVEVDQAFADLLTNIAKAAFDPDVDVRILPQYGSRLEPLSSAIAAALNAIDDVRRSALLRMLCGMVDFRTNAAIQQRLVRKVDRDVLLASTGTVSMEDRRFRTFAEVQETIDALVDIDRLDAAERLLAAYEERARQRGYQWGVWRYKIGLRIALERKEWTKIDAPLPAEVRGTLEGRAAQQFFRGLAALSTDPPKPEVARDLFQRLVDEDPTIPAYRVNLFSATVSVAAHEEIANRDQRIRQALADGLAIRPMLPPSSRSIYETIRFGALALIADWHAIIAEFEQLPAELRPRLGAFHIKALLEVGDEKRATALLAELKSTLDETSVAELQKQVNARLNVFQVSLDNPIKGARLAIERVLAMSVHDQVRVHGALETEGVEAFVMDHLVEVLVEVAQLAPNLAYDPERLPEEDRLTEILISLLNQRLAFVGWRAYGQARLGYTQQPSELGRKGVGECDFTLVGRNVRLTIGEALNLSGRDEGTTKAHLDKVFRYGLSDLEFSFLVVWCFGEIDHVWKNFCEIADGHQTPGFPATMRTAVPEIERRGIRARRVEHLVEGGRIHRVYHLGVDLRQVRRRLAAGQNTP